jgi:hypothetical protein
MMKRVVVPLVAIPAAALLVTAASIPVSAQPAGYNVSDTRHGDWTLKEREDWLSDRLDKARDDGSVGHHEYDRVHSQISGIKDMENSMRGHHHGQLTDDETQMLEAQLNDVADHIQWLHENAFQRPWG